MGLSFCFWLFLCFCHFCILWFFSLLFDTSISLFFYSQCCKVILFCTAFVDVEWTNIVSFIILVIALFCLIILVFLCIHLSFIIKLLSFWKSVVYEYSECALTWRWLSSLLCIFVWNDSFSYILRGRKALRKIDIPGSAQTHFERIRFLLCCSCCSVFTDNYLTLWQRLRQWRPVNTVPTFGLLYKLDELSTWGGWIQQFYTRK